jgi:RNA recognition motif-containing protein
MAMKLFVGGLPWATTSEELKTLFSQYGTVDTASVVTDKMTGRSRGFGFVQFGSDDESNAAINALNGTEFQGRKLLVQEARPMEARAPRGNF